MEKRCNYCDEVIEKNQGYYEINKKNIYCDECLNEDAVRFYILPNMKVYFENDNEVIYIQPKERE